MTERSTEDQGVARLGFLGVGAIGQPMARRLLDAGLSLTVFDVREEAMLSLVEKGARRAASVRELAETCDTVIVSLPTLAVFRAVLDGPEGLLAGGALRTLVNTGTVGGIFIAEVEKLCAPKGITVIDAPISGGVAAAAVGKLVVMVSGDAEAIAGLMPVFRAWGEKIVRAGSTAGAAQTMKVTNNVLCGVTLMATAEAMALSARAGIPDEAMLDIINNATGRSFASSNIFPEHVLTGKFDYGATLGILFKDVDLAVKQGEELGIPMWVCQAARLVLKHAMFQGFGNQDMARARDVIEAAAAPAVTD